MKVVDLARHTIELYLNNGEVYQFEGDLEDTAIKKAATFVSIKLTTGELRGCIGTILPCHDNINAEIISNAINASTKDPRFYPMTKEELDNIVISVDVLTLPFLVKDKSMLDCKKYGVIVSTQDGRRGLLLPNLEGVDSVGYQLEIALQKGGINPTEKYDIEAFEVIRFI